MPSRRSLLALAGGTLAAFAGCAGRGTDPATATTATDVDATDGSNTATTTDVSLEGAAVRRSVAIVGSAHRRIEPGLFVVAAFSAPGVDRPHRAAREAALVLDGDAHDPLDHFPVENAQRPDAASVAFAVREFAVPDATPAGEDVTATLTVENVGGSGGRFLAELGSSALSDRPEVTVAVPAGERVIRRIEVNVVTYETGEIRVVLDTVDDRIERSATLTDRGE